MPASTARVLSASRKSTNTRRTIAFLLLVAATASGLVSPTQAFAQSGLVAAYGFNETTGTTTPDASGNNNTGMLGSGVARTVSGRFGGAMVFSGDFVTVPNAASLNLSTGMTLEAWVFPTTSTSAYATTIMKEQSGDYVYALYEGAPTNPSAEINVTTQHSGERVTGGPSALPVNTWSHLASTYDGTTVQLYVNGVQVASQAVAGPIATSTGALRIGGNSIWGEYFTGLIDEVRIYNRALSVAEVQTDMNTAVGVAADATPPTVAIINPSSTGTFTTAASAVNMDGTAADNVGVTQVTWSNSAGGSGTATGTTSWTVSGVVLQPGANVVTVTAHDAAENVATATLTVTLDATAPTVNLIAPTAGSTVSGSTVSLTASAADNNALAGVTFLLDGVAIGAEVLGPGPTYGFTWNSTTAADGTHALSARARDAAGNLNVSPDVSVIVGNAAASGLVAAYGFNETSGTTADDATGNNNIGTLGTGVTRTVSGRFGGALVFSGNFVTVPHAASLNLTTGMTLEAWVFPTTPSSAYATTLMKEQSGDYVYALYEGAPTNPSAEINVSALHSGERVTGGTSALPVNTWSHLATTYDGTTVRLYLNGVQVASQAIAGPIATSTGALRIGGNGVWGEYFTGGIDEVRIYNRALSVAEVQTDMNTAVGGAPPLDTTAPTIAIVDPSSTGTFTTTAGSLSMDGTAADNVGVAQVTWSNSRGGSGSAVGTTSWSVGGIALQPGANVLTVTARDAAGNTSTATLAVTYNVSDTTVPTVAITSPTSAATYLTNATPVTLGGTSADNVGVAQVTWTNDRGGSGTATGTTTWSVSGIVLQPGANVLTVSARDAPGNVATSTLTVTLDATVPTVSVTTPTPGATVSGSTVTVTASASDDNALAGVQFLLDGIALGNELLSPGPTFTITWNVTGLSNGGIYTLRARARDVAGNTATSSGVSVFVNNAVAAGPVAAYGFNETSGTTTADASGNNNTGTLGSGVARTPDGKFGSALVFSGNFVTVPNAASLNMATALTLEAWVYPTQSSGWATTVMKEQSNDLVYSLYASTPVNPGAYFNLGAAPETQRSVSGAFAPPLNTWTHLATTFDGAMARLFVNGIQVASQAFAGPIVTSNGALRIGGNTIWGEYFTGKIDEVRLYNRALSGNEVYLDMVTAVGQTQPPDNAAPTVAMTSPATGSSVSGSVTLTATANDDVGIAGVQFRVDGHPIGAWAGSAPYTTAWDATAASEGVHTIDAVALDFSGKTTTSASIQVTVTVANGATLGHWSAPFDWPLVSIHTALLHTGEVLGWEYSGAGGPVLWNPLTNQFTPVPTGSNLFCGGQTILSDGRVLVAGGHVDAHVGLPDVNIFDPLTRTWTRGPNMNVGRWYPTVTALSDGRALITAGEINCDGCNVLLPEIYNPLDNTVTQLAGASQNFPYYPHMYVLPDGRILAAASSEEPIVSRVLNLTTQTWSVVDPVAVDGGSSVMYLPGKIMKSGTSHNPDLPPVPSFPRTYVLDMTSASPAWTQTAPMAFARTYHVLTALPDGNVLATGGATTTDPVSDATAVRAAELWNPTTQTWSTLSSGAVSRLYHSVAVLLPDGRVLVSGGGRFYGFPSNDISNHLNAEIFSPPYLYKGARPSITSAPQTATFGATIPVQTPDAAGIASVSLIRLAAVTHAINMDQRFLPLSFTAGSGRLDVQMPANANLAPPGYYMLFIVNGNGVPSTAAIIKMQ